MIDIYFKPGFMIMGNTSAFPTGYTRMGNILVVHPFSIPSGYSICPDNLNAINLVNRCYQQIFIKGDGGPYRLKARTTR